MDSDAEPAADEVEEAALDLARVVRAHLDDGMTLEALSELLELPPADVAALASRA